MDGKKWNKSVAKTKKEKNIDKQIEAHRLRYEEDKTYEEIAELLGYGDRSGAWNAVESAIKFHNIQRAETLDESRAAAVARLEQHRDDLKAKLGTGTNTITSITNANGKNNRTIQTYSEEGELKIYNVILKIEKEIARLLGTYQDHSEIKISGKIEHLQVEDLRAELREQLEKEIIDVEPVTIDDSSVITATEAPTTDGEEDFQSGQSVVVVGR